FFTKHIFDPMYSNNELDIDEFIRPEVDDDAAYKNDDYLMLMKAWLNEKSSPELLQYEEMLVANLMEMLEVQVLSVCFPVILK
ncbi:hypothetical protein HK096_011599, partial [Nowakowskiella sp. JEL0078]